MTHLTPATVLSLMLTALILAFIVSLVRVRVEYRKRKPGDPWISFKKDDD
jgi:hypothetical protein